jgi:hypothetical protein
MFLSNIQKVRGILTFLFYFMQPAGLVSLADCILAALQALAVSLLSPSSAQQRRRESSEKEYYE